MHCFADGDKDAGDISKLTQPSHVCVSAMAEGAVKQMQQLLYKRIREKTVRVAVKILAQVLGIITARKSNAYR